MQRSHELANQLTALLGYAGLLAGTELTGTQREHVIAILRAANISLGLLGDEAEYPDAPAMATAKPMAGADEQTGELLGLVAAALADRAPHRPEVSVTRTRGTARCSACGRPLDSGMLAVTIEDAGAPIARNSLVRLLEPPGRFASAAARIHEMGGHLVLSSREKQTRIAFFTP